MSPDEESSSSRRKFLKVVGGILGVGAIGYGIKEILRMKKAVEERTKHTTSKPEKKYIELGGKDIYAVGNYAVCTYDGKALILAAGSSLTDKIDSTSTVIVDYSTDIDPSGTALANIKLIKDKEGKEIYNSDAVSTPRQPPAKEYSFVSIDELVRRPRLHENQPILLDAVQVEKTLGEDYLLNGKGIVGNVGNVDKLLLDYAIKNKLSAEVKGTTKEGKLNIELVSLRY